LLRADILLLRLLSIFFVSTFCACLVWAQAVHRCTKEGQTVYSQFPCEAGQQTKKVDVKLADIASSQLLSELVWKTYDVTGVDYSGLVRSLAAHGPQFNGKSFHGLAKWNVSYRYETQVAGRQCKFSHIELKIAGEILMPNWRDEAKASTELRQRWSKYYAALKAHEEGHVQHGKELALRLREHFLGLGNFECAEAGGLAQRAFDRIYSNLKDRDRDYDQRTQHGATQGALF
jgi:predicted secreted Zn-dependent protease